MAPQNVRVTPLTASQLEVTWDPPPPESQNGNIQGYKASVSQPSGQAWAPLVCPARSLGLQLAPWPLASPQPSACGACCLRQAWLCHGWEACCWGGDGLCPPLYNPAWGPQVPRGCLSTFFIHSRAFCFSVNFLKTSSHAWDSELFHQNKQVFQFPFQGLCNNSPLPPPPVSADSALRAGSALGTL